MQAAVRALMRLTGLLFSLSVPFSKPRSISLVVQLEYGMNAVPAGLPPTRAGPTAKTGCLNTAREARSMVRFSAAGEAGTGEVGTTAAGESKRPRIGSAGNERTDKIGRFLYLKTVTPRRMFQ